MPKPKARVAVLISGNGGNLQALIDAAQADDYPADIVLVISNNPDAYGLERARSHGIEAVVVNHREYDSRADYDAALQEALTSHRIDFVCLAGFMRLLTPGFVGQWENRMLNIHPSLLPAFKGAHAIRDAWEAKVDKTGCTVHLVIPEMDAGPVIMQAEVSVDANDTQETLAEKIHVEEHRIYPQCLAMLVEGKVPVLNHKS